jgi:hypothetical protein
MKDEEQEIIRLSQSGDFRVEKLRAMVNTLRVKRKSLEA